MSIYILVPHIKAFVCFYLLLINKHTDYTTVTDANHNTRNTDVSDVCREKCVWRCDKETNKATDLRS